VNDKNEWIASGFSLVLSGEKRGIGIEEIDC